MKQHKILFLALMQLSVIIFTSAEVCGKFAASHPCKSLPFIGLYALETAILAIYAIIWQQIIKRIDLSVAYINKSTALLWSLVWAVLLFREHITIPNIIGIVIVMIGVILINSEDKA